MSAYREQVKCRCGVMFDDDGSIVDHQLDDECPYERCDDYSCRALKSPITIEDYAMALDHWKHHSLLCGCSHGR